MTRVGSQRHSKKKDELKKNIKGRLNNIDWGKQNYKIKLQNKATK